MSHTAISLEVFKNAILQISNSATAEQLTLQGSVRPKPARLCSMAAKVGSDALGAAFKADYNQLDWYQLQNRLPDYTGIVSKDMEGNDVRRREPSG